MRISVTGRAAETLEMVTSATAVLRRLVTVDTSDGGMTAGKHKAGLLMTREVESRGVKGGLVVALLTTVEVRCAGELIAVHVLMAGDATGDFDFEYGCAAGRHMTLRAGHFGMLRKQRKRGGFVIGDGILRRLEAIHGVAGFAAAAVDSRQELPVVWIGLMAVGAHTVGDGGLEVSTAMTDITTDFKVLSSKWVLRPGVVELRHE